MSQDNDILIEFGSLEEPVLILEWIMISLFLELTFLFFLRVMNKEEELKSLQEKAYFFLFLGYSLMWIFITIGDFYIENENLRVYVLNIGYLIEICCALAFLYTMEIYRDFFSPYLFTKIYLSLIPVYLFLFILFIDYAAFFSSIFWIIFVVFFLKFSNELYHDFYIKRNLGAIKYQFFELILGVLFVAVGYQLSTRVLMNYLGLFMRFLGDILQIIGAIILFIFFKSIPSFSEYDWKEELEAILVSYKSGLLIYHKNLKEKEDDDTMNYISGILASIEMMIESVTQTEETSMIKRKEKFILIKPGKHIYGVLICRKKLKSLQILLNRFIERVELIYSRVLENWNGDLRILKPIENVAEEIFRI